jgi:hypothetical protein
VFSWCMVTMELFLCAVVSLFLGIEIIFIFL